MIKPIFHTSNIINFKNIVNNINNNDYINNHKNDHKVILTTLSFENYIPKRIFFPNTTTTNNNIKSTDLKYALQFNNNNFDSNVISPSSIKSPNESPKSILSFSKSPIESPKYDILSNINQNIEISNAKSPNESPKNIIFYKSINESFTLNAFNILSIKSPNGSPISATSKLTSSLNINKIRSPTESPTKSVKFAPFRSPCKILTIHIAGYYKKCNPTFGVPIIPNRRVLTSPSIPNESFHFDNEHSDLILRVDDVLCDSNMHPSISNKYKIIDLLGCGTFGQVVKCERLTNHLTKEHYAVKVIKNKPAYHHQALMEIKILKILNNQSDPGNVFHIVRMVDHFLHNNHLCLVFELLNMNLYEVLKLKQYAGMPCSVIRSILTQCLRALSILREARIVHCDLKPENILISNNGSTNIKLIDFGSACFEFQTVYSYIQSRFYRSPEVILGMPYNSAIDMWSIGCIASELFLGLPLFPGSNDYNQISRIIEFYGLPPTHMMQGKNVSKYFNIQPADSSNPGASTFVLKPAEEYSAESNTPFADTRRYFDSTNLQNLIMSYPYSSKFTEKDRETEYQLRLSFQHLLSKILNIDPLVRYTPNQALQHPFIVGKFFHGDFTPPVEAPRKALRINLPRNSECIQMPRSMPVGANPFENFNNLQLDDLSLHSGVNGNSYQANIFLSPTFQSPMQPNQILASALEIARMEASNVISPSFNENPAIYSWPNNNSLPPNSPDRTFNNQHSIDNIPPISQFIGSPFGNHMIMHQNMSQNNQPVYQREQMYLDAIQSPMTQFVFSPNINDSYLSNQFRIGTPHYVFSNEKEAYNNNFNKGRFIPAPSPHANLGHTNASYLGTTPFPQPTWNARPFESGSTFTPNQIPISSNSRPVNVKNPNMGGNPMQSKYARSNSQFYHNQSASVGGRHFSVADVPNFGNNHYNMLQPQPFNHFPQQSGTIYNNILPNRNNPNTPNSALQYPHTPNSSMQYPHTPTSSNPFQVHHSSNNLNHLSFTPNTGQFQMPHTPNAISQFHNPNHNIPVFPNNFDNKGKVISNLQVPEYDPSFRRPKADSVI